MTVNVSKPAINLREKLAELDKPTGIAGEAMLRADTVPDQAELLGYRQQNVIINGAMNVWQRGTSADTASTNDYMCDRWSTAFYGLDGNVDWDQETSSTPDGFGYALKISTDASETSLGSADFLILQQKIEGQNLQHFNKGSSKALPFTVSFWVRSSVASTYTLELSDNDNTRSCSQSYHINQADTWEYKTLVFPADATGAFGNDSGESFRTYFWIDGGSNYTSGTFSTNWQAKADTERVYDTTGWLESTSPTFYITGVQLVAGNYPEGLPFMHRSYGEELALCQRYYYRIDGRSGYSILPTFGAYSADAAAGSVPFPVELRDRPTALEQSGTAGDYFLTDSSGAGQACTSVPTFGGSTHKKGASVVMTSTGNVSAGNASIPTMGANGYLAWSAEL